MGSDSLVNDLSRIATQEASIPALRACVFLFGTCAAFAWGRRKPLVAVLAAWAGGFLGLSYWLLQIETPLGLETDPALTRAWAQAGVNAGADTAGSSFVWGMDPEVSLVSTLASIGIPIQVVHLTPQVAAVLALVLLTLLPFGLGRNRTTASLSACLALGGGLWPGVSPYGSILLRPSTLLVAVVLAALLLVAARARAVRKAVHRNRLGLSVGLGIAAVLDRAWAGGSEAPATAALFLCAATLLLTPPLRAGLRKVASSRAPHLEALVLLCVFAGSGLLWWDPPRSVAGFDQARDENAALLNPLSWVKQHVPGRSVVLASPAYSGPIAALSGRRVLFPPREEAGNEPPLREPFRRARLNESVRQGQPLERLAEAFSVTHLFLGPGEATPHLEEAAPEDEPRLALVLVYQDAKDFRIFRLAKK